MNYFKITYGLYSSSTFVEAHNVVIALNIFGEVFPGFVSQIKHIGLVENDELIEELDHDLSVLRYSSLEVSF